MCSFYSKEAKESSPKQLSEEETSRLHREVTLEQVLSASKEFTGQRSRWRKSIQATHRQGVAKEQGRPVDL